jgi:TolB protein
MFTPDGRSLVFYSNRDGGWAAWIVGVDGSNLRRITKPEGGVIYPMVSPKGDSIVFMSDSARLGMFSAPLDSEATPTQLPGTTTGGRHFSLTGWSPDGARLAGYLMSDSGRPSGVAVYDLAAQTTTMTSPDETFAVKWLADNRRVMYFTKNGRELVVLDTVTRTRTVVDVRLPGPSAIEMFAISPDNRTIYYGATRSEADIWIVERK